MRVLPGIGPDRPPRILGSPFHTLPFLLLRPHLSADSWASFSEAQKEALVWG